MLLSELNMKALNVSAESILPVVRHANVEGHEIEFKITAFQSGYGSGKKSVVSGSVKRADTGVLFVLENSDIESIRRKVARLVGLKNSERKPRAPKAVKEVKISEVEKMRQNLAVARRLPKEWVRIDANKLRAAFIDARKKDKAPQKLASLAELDAAKQLKAYELLKKAGLI